MSYWQKQSSVERVELICLCLTALTIIAMVVDWIPAGYILFRGDPIFPLAPLTYAQEQLISYSDKVNLGQDSLRTASFYYQWLQALPELLGASLRTSEIIHLILWQLLPLVTIFNLGRYLVRRFNWPAFSGLAMGWLYIFNQYRVAQIIDNNHLVIYASLPLMTWLWLRTTESRAKPLQLGVWLGLASLMVSSAGTNPPMMGIWLGFNLVMMLALTVAAHESRRNVIKASLVGLVTGLLIQSFWLVPFILTNIGQVSLSASGNLDWLQDLSNQSSPERIIRLIGAWDWFTGWQGERYNAFVAYLEQPKIWRLALLPAVLALFGLLGGLFIRKALIEQSRIEQSSERRIHLAFQLTVTGLMILGLILSHGTHPPFTSLYQWLAEHWPGFWIYRSPWYKFTNLTAFGFAIWGGFAIGWLLELAQKIRQQQRPAVDNSRVAAFGLMISLGLILIPLRPWFDGTRYTIDPNKAVLPDLIPEARLDTQVASYLNQLPTGGIGILPYMPSEIYRDGYGSITSPYYYLLTRPYFERADRVGYPPGLTSGAGSAYRVFVEHLYSNNPDATLIARAIGLRYLVVRGDTRFDYYGAHDGPAEIRAFLKDQPEAQLIQTVGETEVYELTATEPRPVLTTATQSDRFIGDPIDGLGTLLGINTSASQPWPVLLFTTPEKQPEEQVIDVTRHGIDPQTPPPPLVNLKATGTTYTAEVSATTPFWLTLNRRQSRFWQIEVDGGQATGPVISLGYAPAWKITPDCQIDCQPLQIKISHQLDTMIKPLFTVHLLALIVFTLYLYSSYAKNSYAKPE
ncbi:MAG: hypothetical protein CEO22_438 [Candidatus Berkelbacteria bacterium Gr01-1014_85]|uniref:Membrane protein 6-pyruvoyl-tetrahydropterin synthase-related domain-containing protein n=1 Tax=Candidatus Berkelbacteria bacterium Gr01-1014_85 TaxID=2017150 RepID=A0A554JB42_9BACT|nr:MAG: hypothetical protein CEO22_438 [Candidatus Berkelbacteria bacterium Gr01-1014_85]